jgi:hypothetical protein
MPRSDDQASPAVGKKNATPADNSNIFSDSDLLSNHHLWIDDIKDVIECYSCIIEEECFLNLPIDMDEDNPLDLETVKEEQADDNVLRSRVMKYPDHWQGLGHLMPPEARR